MLIELLGDVPVLIGKRKWWVGFGKTVNEHGLCLFIYFKSGFFSLIYKERIDKNSHLPKNSSKF